MANSSVRLAYREDLKAMHRVESECFAAPWSYEAFEENFYNPFSIYTLAESDDEVVGFGGMQVIFDEAHIMNIAVLPSHRRQGLASDLLKLMIDEARARKAVIMFLEVRASNVPAQTLYKKFGFEPMGVRKQYYSDNNEDAVIMTLNL
ncbi:MAG: ribosomal protein S18-alanine N-acetyltransferase [Clostridia bacterium]|nr:ribosomal protein S18-alanine N-acetyltransferase [Clostridia bacterium]